ncbi:hypothetical protein [Streptomyces iconiensis]|uniref:Tat (Twin-arginine translocation) pathway signal sequence n=1 Tax=Streptomyces iconiensis TaxID=1384038 RepID=A0ABT7A1R3_9ACTN|nr:hypothetical protein [Streptomyces iconiensis]MDJ1135254.1 hypothetical protein [Streptomyces iconiensis]
MRKMREERRTTRTEEGPAQVATGRRSFLRTSLGAAAVVGLGAAATGTAHAGTTARAAGARQAAEAPEAARVARIRPGGDPDFPDVPGMLGDRRANEFWYWFDEVTLYKPSAEINAAYEAIEKYIPGGLETGIRDLWLKLSGEPGYPENYAAHMRPVDKALRVLSRAQLGVVDRFYRPRDIRLTAAFSWFGQGVLFDPRRAEAHSPVHTMNFAPGMAPIGYHVWHAYMRAMMLRGIDAGRWAALAPLNGFAWAVQSTAKPSMTEVSKPLPAAKVVRLAATWLPRSARHLDGAFRSIPYPVGIE